MKLDIEQYHHKMLTTYQLRFNSASSIAKLQKSAIQTQINELPLTEWEINNYGQDISGLLSIWIWDAWQAVRTATDSRARQIRSFLLFWSNWSLVVFTSLWRTYHVHSVLILRWRTRVTRELPSFEGAWWIENDKSCMTVVWLKILCNWLFEIWATWASSIIILS